MLKAIPFARAAVAALALLMGFPAPGSAATLLDTTFDPGTGASGGIVEQVLPLSDGRMLICGNFTRFNGRPKSYVARLHANGSVDESFTAQPGYWVRNMSVQPDGKIVIGGFFTTVAGVPRNLVARLNSDGSLDTSFNPGTGATDIIAGGIDGNNTPFVFWTAVQPDGKILITGNFRNYNGASSVGLARLNPDGSRDASFNVGGGLDSWGRHILIQPNGQILVSGWFQAYRGNWFNRLVRINPDGSPDTTFNPFFGDRTAIYGTALPGGGKVVAVGHSLNEQGLFKREMARLNPNGSVDESFVAFTNEKTESVVIQPDGKVIVGGYFTFANNTPRARLARFHADGTLDTGFSANIDNFIWSCALQPDGKLLIAGGFNSVDGVSRVGVARLLTGASGGGTPEPVDSAPQLSASGATPSTLTITWTDSSQVRTGYDIERKNGANFERIAQVGSGTRSHTVTALASETSYTFRLRAHNSLGGSLFSNEATGTTSPGAGSGGSGGVTFIGSDTSTRGSWIGVHGAEGFGVMGDRTSWPSYVGVTPIGKQDWTWQWSTQDAAALQRSAGTDRIAACWYSSSSFSINLNFTDGQSHRVALYFLDWDKMGRVQTVQVSDAATGQVLDSRSVSGFGNGIYLIWSLSGNVKITVAPQSGNAVVSGLFFGGSTSGGGGGGTTPTAGTPTISPNGGTVAAGAQVTLSTSTSGAQIRYTLDGADPSASSTLYSGAFTLNASATVKAKAFAAGHNPSATASASFTVQSSSGGGSSSGATFRFVGVDNTTKGNWRGVYGADGYNVIAAAASYPTYAQVSPSGNQQWVWNQTTGDARALWRPDGSSRVSSCWYQSSSFEVNINLIDGNTHRVAVYICDFDNAGRSQSVELVDAATGAVLHAQSASGFSGGQYLIYELKGSHKLRITKVAGPNAVISGLFFQPAASQL